jgi:hypothetical protein
MGWLDGLKSLFGGAGAGGDGGYYVYVRCKRCGEALRTRVNLRNDLSLDDSGGYVLHKTLVGSRRCFERIEVTMTFGGARQLTNREISGGEFITAEEYGAATRDNAPAGP